MWKLKTQNIRFQSKSNTKYKNKITYNLRQITYGPLLYYLNDTYTFTSKLIVKYNFFVNFFQLVLTFNSY